MTSPCRVVDVTVNARTVSPGREPPEFKDDDIDHEAAAGLQVRGDVAEALDLFGPE